MRRSTILVMNQVNDISHEFRRSEIRDSVEGMEGVLLSMQLSVEEHKIETFLNKVLLACCK